VGFGAGLRLNHRDERDPNQNPPKILRLFRLYHSHRLLLSSQLFYAMSPTQAATTAATWGRKKSASRTAPTKSSSRKTTTSTASSPLSAATSRSKRKLDHDTAEPTTNGTKRRNGTNPSVPLPSSRKKIIAQPVHTVRKSKTQKVEISLTRAPTQRLNVYVFGGNSGGELGLGPRERSGNVARPRLNPNLAAASVGVVQIATGGMHCVALTYDNKILT
jgi:regulator of chromosome condensation